MKTLVSVICTTEGCRNMVDVEIEVEIETEAAMEAAIEAAACEMVYCEECERENEYMEMKQAAEDVLEAGGWRLAGKSGKSEATYFSHEDFQERIRVAAHDAVYASSAECVQVELAHCRTSDDAVDAARAAMARCTPEDEE